MQLSGLAAWFVVAAHLSTNSVDSFWPRRLIQPSIQDRFVFSRNRSLSVPSSLLYLSTSSSTSLGAHPVRKGELGTFRPLGVLFFGHPCIMLKARDVFDPHWHCPATGFRDIQKMKHTRNPSHSLFFYFRC